MTNRLALCATVLLACLVTGCAAAPVPPQPDVTALVLAHPEDDLRGDPAVQWFIDEVAEVSGGQLEIEVAKSCCGAAADRQSILIDGVASGEFDLGWLPVRGLGDLGLTDFEALESPLLIDRYAAQRAVLDSTIPAELLPSLDTLGVTGVALEPGMLRRPISNDLVLRNPADFEGLSFWAARSSLSAAALTALGATPNRVSDNQRDRAIAEEEIGAVENSLFWQMSTEKLPDPVITRNVAFWPEISAIVANPDTHAELSDVQTAWLQKAALTVSMRSMDVAAVDAAAVADYCAGGGRLSVVTPDERANWETALEPVYADLESDPDTAALLDTIRGLIPNREELANELNPPADCHIP